MSSNIDHAQYIIHDDTIYESQYTTWSFDGYFDIVMSIMRSTKGEVTVELCTDSGETLTFDAKCDISDQTMQCCSQLSSLSIFDSDDWHVSTSRHIHRLLGDVEMYYTDPVPAFEQCLRAMILALEPRTLDGLPITRFEEYHNFFGTRATIVVNHDLLACQPLRSVNTVTVQTAGQVYIETTHATISDPRCTLIDYRGVYRKYQVPPKEVDVTVQLTTIDHYSVDAVCNKVELW